MKQRLIDAEKMKTRIHLENMEVMESAIKAWIDKQETVDAEPVRHGHWIRSSDGYWDECSKCHASIDISMGSNLYNADGDEVEHDWCPHCGAKMDEVTDETD